MSVQAAEPPVHPRLVEMIHLVEGGIIHTYSIAPWDWVGWSTRRAVITMWFVNCACPYLWGYKSAKCVIGITLEARSIPGYWEMRGYPDHGQIKSRKLLDVNSQQMRRIPDGEVIEFLD